MDYQRLLTICEEKKMSIPELAKKIGFSRQGLIKAITGGSMKIDTLEHIGKALNISVFELIDGIHFNELNTEILNLRDDFSDVSNKCDELENENKRLQTSLTEISDMLLHYKIIVKQYRNIYENHTTTNEKNKTIDL
jgi:transcriptional regulator with XRE-family HTH domain